MSGALWGGQKINGEQDDAFANGAGSRPGTAGDSLDYERRQPDEHTRLLPNRVESTPYLSPDDPAVTPYNLWSVRIVRWLTVAFTALTFVWWVILLISAFVTPPGFQMRGSGFFAFGYASLALANLAFTLVFFAIPSKAVRILSIVLSVILLIDAVLLISVDKTRHEEGWVGMVSVLWVFVMAVFTLATDRLVQWGKQEEEERLTGRAESRRTLGQWTAVLLSIVIMAVLVAAAFLITCTLILRALDAGLAPPGKMYWVDGGKYQMHVYCQGSNETAQRDGEGAASGDRRLPTVLFEGGSGPVEDGLWQLADQSVKNGSISRYCFVDRPGLAWSDTAPSPLSAGMAVEAVSEALARAGEDGPWVLASAGIGSLYSRILSARLGPQRAWGLLLIDPLHEEQLDGEVGSASRGLSLWLRGALSPLGLDRVPGAVLRGRTKEDRVWGRSAYQSGKSALARLQESLVAATLSRRDVDSSRAIQDPDVPLTVVSSSSTGDDDSRHRRQQQDLTRLTRRLLHWDIVEGAPHEVWATREGRDVIEKRLKQLVRTK